MHIMHIRANISLAISHVYINVISIVKILIIIFLQNST